MAIETNETKMEVHEAVKRAKSWVADLLAEAHIYDAVNFNHIRDAALS